jgi:RNA polymerase sigma-70 factor (ECF subfamily)
MDAASSPVESGTALLRLYDEALPTVYGYLLRRCGREDAEELTSETFLAAVDAVRRGGPRSMDLAWLIGVARHKLADHWRRQARDERRLQAVASDATARDGAEDPWDARLQAVRAEQTLAAIAPQYRAALTLRYVDDLPVAEVANLLGRPVQATEALLVRARAAFRACYVAGEEGVGGDA